MPMITIEFDETKVNDQEILDLSNAVQKIVSNVTKIEDVFVYANSARVKVKVAPIEVFIRMSAHKISILDMLFNEVKTEVSAWKKSANFQHPVNLTIIPMQWKFETGI